MILKLALSIIICELAGIVGSIFTAPAISSWYLTLAKPVFTPPNWLFAPVWLTLYALIGIAAYLVYEKGISKKNVQKALSIFAFQLGLNILWSVIFFGLRNPFWGFAEIVILWFAILATIISFYRISKPAGIILIPYIVWVTIASTLNYFVWVLN